MDLQLDFLKVLWAILRVSFRVGPSLMIVGHLNIGAGRVVWQVLVLTTQWTYIRILCVSINLSKPASLPSDLPSSKLSTMQRRGTEDFISLVSFRMVVSIL